MDPKTVLNSCDEADQEYVVGYLNSGSSQLGLGDYSEYKNVKIFGGCFRLKLTLTGLFSLLMKYHRKIPKTSQDFKRIFLCYCLFVFLHYLNDCPKIKDSVFGGSVFGGSVFLTSDDLINRIPKTEPLKPNP